MSAEHDRETNGQNYVFGADLDLRWWLRVLQGGIFTLTGAVYTFGPPWFHSSGNFYYINSLLVPFWVWSLLFLLCGLVLLVDIFPFNWVPYTVLSLVSLFWGIGQGLAVINDPPPPPGDIRPHLPLSGGGPILMLGLAAYSLLFLFISAKEFTMYRAERHR